MPRQAALYYPKVPWPLPSTAIEDASYNTSIRIYDMSGPAEPDKLKLKPLIKELIRTEVIVPNIVLLVDKLSIIPVTSSSNATPVGAYRMYLSDGKYTIQAVFKRRIHKQIASLEIREGSYIALTDYKLDSAPSSNHNGNIQYLAVSDFKWMGEERRYELQKPDHEFFGDFKPRPEKAHVLLNHPGSDPIRTIPKQTEVNNWRMRYHHLSHQGEQYQVACSRFIDPPTGDPQIGFLPDCDANYDAAVATENVKTLGGTPVEMPSNYIPNSPSKDDKETIVEHDTPAKPESTGKVSSTEVNMPGKKRKRDDKYFDRPTRALWRRGPRISPTATNLKAPKWYEPPDERYRMDSRYPPLIWLRERHAECSLPLGSIEFTTLNSLAEGTQILYDPDPKSTVVDDDRDDLDIHFLFPGPGHEKLRDFRQSKWVLRIPLSPRALLDNGISVEDVEYTIQFSREDIYVIYIEPLADFKREGTIRIRRRLEESSVDDKDSMIYLRTALMDIFVQKGTTPNKHKLLKRDKIVVQEEKESENEQAQPVVPKVNEDKETICLESEAEPRPFFHHGLTSWEIQAARSGKPLQPIDHPLKLSTLASVTGLNRSRNKVVDVLAKVDSVDDFTVKRTNMPLKRDIQITDASTTKKVTLSIFVDPLNCIPTVGEIVLFRNLVTHDFKGGNLNAYPKQCEGKIWYIPDPQSIDDTLPDLDRKKLGIWTDAEEEKLIGELTGGAKLDEKYSIKWPKEKRMAWRVDMSPEDVEQIKKMQKWGRVKDPKICPQCGEPHCVSEFDGYEWKAVRGGMTGVIDPDRKLTCIKSGHYTDDESD